MDERDVFQAAGDLTGRPASAAARHAPSVYESECESEDWLSDLACEEGFRTTAAILPRLDRDQPAEEGAAPQLAAQWALWGKDDDEADYHVLWCSKGTFDLGDFDEIVTRYASGVKETLPQYTACWIPAQTRDQGYGAATRRGRSSPSVEEKGDNGYLAVGIHELADPRRSGGRARSAAGREIEYIRLFCVRYKELADFGVGYANLVDAVRERQLPPDDPTQLIPVPVPDCAQRRLPLALAELARNVAALLLTTRPVCVLGAESASAEDRLLFIDSVMALLPYGLRTTLSASTWASATAQDLKLRLFFSNAKRDDGGRTRYVTWGQPAQLDFPTVGDEAPWLYLSWLRQASSGALAELFGATAPVRFNQLEIREMVANLPEDRPVADALRRLADHLRDHDQAAITAEVQRLNRYLVRVSEPAERLPHRRLIVELGLLRDHRWLHHSTRASVYRVLLKLAFETPLSYASYCEIEDAIGGPPRGMLRSVLLRLPFATKPPWILTVKADPDISRETLMDSLAEQHVPPTALVTMLQRHVEAIRLAHRSVIYDVAVHYMRASDPDARAEFVRRGYLADTLEVVFPDDRKAQRVRLQAALVFVYGASLGMGPNRIRRIWDRIRRRRSQTGLSTGQVRELFANPRLVPTPAFVAAVERLAASRKARRFIEKQAALARIQNAGLGDDVRILLRNEPRRYQHRAPVTLSDTIAGFPKMTVYAGLVFFCLIAAYILFLWLTQT